jgi:hypothetical protein
VQAIVLSLQPDGKASNIIENVRRGDYRLAKLSYTITVVCLVAIGFLNYTGGEEWVHYGTNDLADKDSIRILSKGVISIWIKTFFNDKERIELIEQRRQKRMPTTGFESLSYSKCLIVISCVDEKYDVTACIDYASDERILDSSQVENTEWSTIPRDTPLYSMMKYLCKKTKESK